MNTDSTTARKKKITQIILAVPMIVLLYLAVHGFWADYQNMQNQKIRLAARTATAEGTVVRLYKAARGTVEFSKEVVVFTTDSGRQIEFSVNAYKSDTVGMKMPVYYDPLHSDNYSLNKETYSYSDIISGNIFFLLFGLYFLFLIFRVRSSSSE